jgi:hypothetical protein
MSPPLFSALAMKPEDLKKLVYAKRRWSEPLTVEDRAKGFKGWYSSKYLPHFDSPGAQQYITYRLADSLPAERRGEWETILAKEDELEKQRKLEHYLDLGHGACHLRNPRIAELVQRAFWHYAKIFASNTPLEVNAHTCTTPSPRQWGETLHILVMHNPSHLSRY